MSGSFQHPVALTWDLGPDRLKKLRNKILLHFQKTRESGGGECEIRDIDCSRGYILIHFRERAARDRVLQKTQVLRVDGKNTLQLKIQLPDGGNTETDATKSPPPARADDGAAESPVDRNSGEAAPATEEEEEVPRVEDELTQENPPSSLILIQNLQESCSSEMLNLLVENISGKTQDSDFCVERIPEIQSAVVTFTSEKETSDFTGKFSGSPRAKQLKLKARYLEESRTVRVEGLPPNISEDHLSLYFESPRNGGGSVETMEMFPEEGAAIITFPSAEVIKTVLGRQHVFSNKNLSVYPYYPSISQCLYGKEGPSTAALDPVPYPISLPMWEFIYNNTEIRQAIEQQMSDHYCDVTWPDPGHTSPVITLSFPSMLSAHARTLAKIAPAWSTKVHTMFSRLISNYKVIECELKPQVWDAIKEKVTSAPYDGIFIRPDLGAEKVSIVGISEELTKVEPKFRKLVEEYSRKLSKVEDQVPIDPAAYRLMYAHGLETSLQEDSPNLKISYDPIAMKVKLTGPKDEVLNAKCEILNSKQGMKTKCINLDPYIIQFLMLSDNEEMSCMLLMSNNIKAAFQVKDKTVTLTGFSDEDLTNAETQLKRELSCKRFSIQDKSVTNSPEWRSLTTFIMDTFNTEMVTVLVEEFPVGESIEVAITGLSSSAEESYQQIYDYLKKNTLVQKDIKLDSVAIFQFIEEERKQDWGRILQNVKVVKNLNLMSLSGPELYVTEAEDYITRISSTLHSDILYIDKPGAKKFCMDNEDMYVMTVKNKFNCVIYLQKDGTTASSDPETNLGEPVCEIAFPNGTTITVYKGELCHHNVDVIITASKEDLTPVGRAALELMKAAGPELQAECQSIIEKEGNLEAGECEITGAGNLPCKEVIHAVGPKKPSSKWERLLRKAITKSLEMAAGKSYSSVALSVASFGHSGIPIDTCAENILKSLKPCTESQDGGSSIQIIHLVDRDDDTIKTVTKLLKEEFGDENVQVTPKQRKKRHLKIKSLKKAQMVNKGDTSLVTTKEGVTVNIIQGNIEDTKSNVVVNSVGKDLDLGMGAVSKALYKKAGNKLQALVNAERQGKAVEDGSVFVTAGCNLTCDTVMHVVAPQWDGDQGAAEKILRNIVQTCLSETEKRMKRSITFPAIGTGALGFPRNTAAAIMFAEIIDFSSKKRPTHLREVIFMLHPRDQDTVQAFSSEIEKKIGSGQKKVEKSPIRAPSSGLYEMSLGPVTFQVKTGDISRETADVIVHVSTSSTMSDIKTELAKSGPSMKMITVSDKAKPDEIKQSVVKVLKTCDKQKASAIAMSIMESGWGAASSAEVAEAVMDAVTDFVSSKSPKSVKSLKVVTSQQQVLNDFHASMKKREGSAATKSSSWFSRVTSSIVNYVTGNTKDEDEEEEETNVFELRENIEPAIFHLCAESRDAVSNASSWLRDLILKEQHENTITDDWIQDFDEKDHDALVHLQRTYLVTVKFDSYSSTIKVLGLSKDVLEVSNKIQDMVKIVRDKKTRQREADLCSNLVEWKYHNGTDFVPLDKMTNMELEKAKTEDIQMLNIDIAGLKYTVIVELEVARDSTGNPIKLQRVSKHEQSIPSTWVEMKDSNLQVVPLSSTSQEYQGVQTQFAQTCQMKIIKIDRIQNKSLWLNYQIKKRSIDEKNRNLNNEMQLFHGTDAKTIDHVNNNGFNRSYAGKTDAKIGKGTYFAVEAIYSSDDNYSIPDANKYKYMYLARVLTGAFCKGEADMIVPKPKDPTNPTNLYDSAADDLTKPTVFVIFNDIQAYPEYLITFTV
ncbi:protein mono-ADP-ribosyltransferase PARP14-like [Hyperolius riggenbachi]|uniref:protein mono-ADP-ribosyltransferase PARP14-like n=1 Tax=Hyperolius riggenbachi TaxID=752182 RepID=UPI0035A2B878